MDGSVDTDALLYPGYNPPPIHPASGAVTTSSRIGTVQLGFTLRRCMIFPVILFYFTGGGILLYTLPQYVQSVIRSKYSSGGNETFNACTHENKSDPAYQTYLLIQQESARWMIYLSLSSLIPTMFGNLIWVPLTDIYGRKFLLYQTIVCALVRLVLMALTIHYQWSLVYLLAGCALDGLSGSYFSFLAVMFTYSCDVTESGKKRTIAIIFMELQLAIVFTATSLFTGYLITDIGFLWPAVIASGCLVLAFLLVFVVPETRHVQQLAKESLARESRHARSSDSAVRYERLHNEDSEQQAIRNSTQSQNVTSSESSKPSTLPVTALARVKQAFSSTGQAFRFYFSSQSGSRRLKYVLLMAGFTFMTIPYLTRGGMEILYQLGQPFCWSATKIGSCLLC